MFCLLKYLHKRQTRVSFSNCNTVLHLQGILFLEDYDLEEYNPFDFDVRNQQDSKVICHLSVSLDVFEKADFPDVSVYPLLFLQLSTEDLKERVHHRRCSAAGMAGLSTPCTQGLVLQPHLV